jgi:ATP adenylyltransferase
MDPSRIQLRPGTLWPALVQREQSALASGAMQPIGTVGEILPDAGVSFIVRKVSSLARKEQARRREGGSNPFLPYEKELFVTDVSDSHLALLNKFNVLEHHLLIVTRRYADQESLIDADDLAALAACMREFDSLGFYNAGRHAGASQPHKHLQLVPLPLERGGTPVPVEPLFEPVRGVKGLCRLPALAFRHAFSWMEPAWFDEAALASKKLRELYLGMLAAVGLSGIEVQGHMRQSGPYNLLLTRRWMLLVPRSREHFGPVSVNALGFAGSMFVRDDAEMRAVRQAGPMRVLAGVVPGPE